MYIDLFIQFLTIFETRSLNFNYLQTSQKSLFISLNRLFPVCLIIYIIIIIIKYIY